MSDDSRTHVDPEAARALLRLADAGLDLPTALDEERDRTAAAAEAVRRLENENARLRRKLQLVCEELGRRPLPLEMSGPLASMAMEGVKLATSGGPALKPMLGLVLQAADGTTLLLPQTRSELARMRVDIGRFLLMIGAGS